MKARWIYTAFVFATILALFWVGCSGDDDDDNNGSDDDDDSDGDTSDRVVDYIRSAPYSRLVIEVDSAAGYEPEAAALELVSQRLGQILDKPGGVEVVLDQTIDESSLQDSWTGDQLHSLAEQTYDLAVDGDTIKMHILYLPGNYAGDGEQGNTVVLGVAWANLHAAMFKETIQSSCSTLDITGQVCRKAEGWVLTHEIGHILGLVNNGLEMTANHEDPEHTHHDHDDSCIMYWAYAGTSIFDVLLDRLFDGNSEDIGFGQVCLDDIAAIREN